MDKGWQLIGLEDLGIIRLRGVEAARFLQGQLSNDLTRLGPGQSLLAGYHNPQGRTIALLRLVHYAADDLLAIVPAELASAVASRLSRYVLRAKVTIANESASWKIGGVVGAATAEVLVPGGASPALAPLPSRVSAQIRAQATVLVRVANDPARWLAISPADVPHSGIDSREMARGDRTTWRQLDVAAGMPQVYAATSEEFVAQMLNLDVLDAISFEKGCYTGQEVIARAHYRGRVKRRMRRFASAGPCQLAPGASAELADGRSVKVVEAALRSDGRCEFLAVAPLAAGERDEAGHGAAPIGFEALPLPYPLPD